MYNFLIAYNATIREILNGSLFPLSLFLSGMIGYYLWGLYRLTGSMWHWRNYTGSQTACVMFWIFLAEGARSGTVWYIYRTDNVHLNVATSSAVSLIGVVTFMVAAMILIAAMLRATYLFTPRDVPWRNRAWKWSAAGTLLFNAVSLLTDIYEVF